MPLRRGFEANAQERAAVNEQRPYVDVTITTISLKYTTGITVDVDVKPGDTLTEGDSYYFIEKRYSPTDTETITLDRRGAVWDSKRVHTIREVAPRYTPGQAIVPGSPSTPV